MDFLIKLDIDAGISSFKEFTDGANELPYIQFSGNNSMPYSKIEAGELIWYIVGDLIIPVDERSRKEEFLKETLSDFYCEKIRQLKGTFYLISLDKRNNKLEVYNSMLSILPVYYYRSDSDLLVSSRMDLIIACSGKPIYLNKRCLLERLLFGYSLFDLSPWEDINMLSTNSFLRINKGEVQEIKHTYLMDFFVSSPLGWKKGLDYLSDLFISESTDYLPDKPYFASFTGGLDSRSLVALSFGLGRKFSAYSYGGEEDNDIQIPQNIANILGLNYYPFILDSNYARDQYLESTRKSTAISEGGLRWSRSHYNMIAQKLSTFADHVVTGNFGSELFRTMRLPGNMISEHIFDIFDNIQDGELADKIRRSPRLDILRDSEFKSELEELTEIVVNYRRDFPVQFTANQKFYYYLLTEVFRKYFGPEIIVQKHYLYNRTPYLDFGFISELLKSELSGANGTFRNNNPISRFRGQALYPEIIRKTYPGLMKFGLDRGYSPNDLKSWGGKTRIVAHYLKRRIISPDRARQPEYSKIIINNSIERINKIPVPGELIDIARYSESISENGWRNNYISLINIVSYFDYIDYIKKANSNVRI